MPASESLKCANILEVFAITHQHGSESVNERLASGDWILLQCKIVQRDVVRSRGSESETRREYAVVYVLGRAR